MKLGVDIGSTTIKCVVLNEKNEVIHKSYVRHRLEIKEKLISLFNDIKVKLASLNGSNNNLKVAFSGSSALGIAKSLNFTFIQEVYAEKVAIKALNPKIDTAIELGGEDAKILFLKEPVEIKMNGTCAGGTGSFIDQMATLLGTNVKDFNELSKLYKKIYPIASRCGVFAKTDVQSLLNEGISKSDIAKSVLESVTNQTVVGLSGGRKIYGNVLYLGGPLTFFSELRNSFNSILNLDGFCPEDSLYYVAIGTALSASKEYSLDFILEKLKNYTQNLKSAFYEPLFKTKKEYEEFLLRHNKFKINVKEDSFNFPRNVFVGIDAGSTTVKCVIINEKEDIIFNKYLKNNGNPVNLVKDFLKNFYENNKDAKVKASAATGYGENLIKNAFNLDFGIVETVAHLKAAKKFLKDAEFIIDIGGQDIKCFKVNNGVIEDIFLNEACSSGCGSFLQSFSNALGFSAKEFSFLGLFSKNPVNLGSRCTVFMNSAIKEAQKNGAKIEDISAGLSISVVKNALYKVIRVNSAKELGEKIVVQGGTFLNDAVLRAFEKELNINVVRPNIAGLMGAYGAALYAKQQYTKKIDFKTTTANLSDLNTFASKVCFTKCKGCTNNCELTINTFSNNKKYISGNKCENFLKNETKKNEDSNFNKLDIYEYKLSLLSKYRDNLKLTKEDIISSQNRIIAIPFVLNMYELLPFWYTFFKNLGFKVIVSLVSNKDTYSLGKNTIPSDTVCYPAKLVHGHIISLLKMGIKNIFYPSMSYSINEKIGDNHYNCPVVAYYPELIAANIKEIKKINFINDYIGVHRKYDFTIRIHKILNKYFKNISFLDVILASYRAYKEYFKYKKLIIKEGSKILNFAKNNKKQTILLAGRPYHIDPEINHNINKLITSLGFALITEDSIEYKGKYKGLGVLNQWAYQSRIYKSAEFILGKKNINLVQLTSFGCGTDSIVADEVKNILNKGKKIYTGIKIDENSNLGAIKIRLRSLLEAILEQSSA